MMAALSERGGSVPIPDNPTGRSRLGLPGHRLRAVCPMKVPGSGAGPVGCPPRSLSAVLLPEGERP